MVAIIAGEILVAAITGQSDGDIAARQLRDKKCRYLRRIGEGFVIDIGQPADDGLGGGRFDDQFGVLGAEMPGDRARMRGFVESLVVIANRERPHRPARLFLHQGHDRR